MLMGCWGVAEIRLIGVGGYLFPDGVFPEPLVSGNRGTLTVAGMAFERPFTS